MGLAGLPAQRFRHTTDSTHGQPVAPNVLARHFGADHPNERWTTDITYIWTWEGWLYLAVVLDLYARRVVGWAVQPHLQTALALEALQMALGRRVPATGLVHPYGKNRPTTAIYTVWPSLSLNTRGRSGTVSSRVSNGRARVREPSIDRRYRLRDCRAAWGPQGSTRRPPTRWARGA